MKNKHLAFVGIGFELVGLMLVAIYISPKLESLWPSGGLITSLVFLACLAGWFFHIWYLLKKIESDSSKP